MKKNTNYFYIAILLIASLFSSCTSDYSKYQGEPSKEKNEITTYNKPYLQKEINGLGWSLNLGITAGVGFGVYQLVPANYTKDLLAKGNINLSDQNIKIAQGALAGIITFFINKAIMNDTTVTAVTDYNVENWLKGINKNLLKVDFIQNSYIKTVPKDIDGRFVINNINDVKFFRKMFPKSNFTEELISKSYSNLKDYELPQLVEVFPDLKISNSIKSQIINNSVYLKDYIYYANMYKDVFETESEDRINAKLETFIKNVDDLKMIKSIMNHQPENNYLESKGLSFINNINDIDKFNKLFPNHNKQKEIEDKGLSYINSVNDAIDFLNVNPKIANYFAFEELAVTKINSLNDLKLYKEKIQKNKTADEQKIIGYNLIKNVDDLIAFDKIYPEDKYIGKSIDKLYENLNRDDISRIISNFPFTDRKEKLSEKYIATIQSMDDAIDAVDKFKEKKSDIAKIANNYLKTVSDHRKYLTTFDDAPNVKEVRKNYYQMITVEPENLGNKLNNKYSEYCPIISPDGETLYFVRRDKTNPNDNEEIYYARLDAQDIWGSAKNIGAPLNDKNHNGVNGVSQDGNTLLLHNYYQKKGSGLSMSFKTKNGWSNPIDLDIPDFHNNTGYHNACLAADERTILISSGRNDSYGANDLYVIRQDQLNKWTKPLNLGPTINTEKEESSVFLAADGETIYFSSNGRGGFGGYDIFMSRRLDNTWTKWSEPENLGKLINTTLDEQFYVIPASGEFVYYSSDNNSLGQSDLYRIGLPEDKRPKAVALVTGKVINKKTSEPLAANIFYEDLKSGNELGKAKTNPDDGIFKLVLPKGKTYGIRADAKGFYPVNENLDLTGLENFKRVNMDLSLVPIEKGQIANINNLFFDFAKYDLKPESFLELNRLIKLLKDYPEMNLEIAGHTDNVGSDKKNMKLSEQRAKSVVDYLTAQGISNKRLKAVGYGAKSPVVPNDSDFNRAKNRRVELKFI